MSVLFLGLWGFNGLKRSFHSSVIHVLYIYVLYMSIVHNMFKMAEPGFILKQQIKKNPKIL